MDEHNNLQIAYIKKLTNKSFNSTFSIAIDANVNIKTILNTDCKILCEKVECTNGKAIVSGKLVLKVTYIDTDNQTTTIQESQSFSENLTDNSLTSNCFLNVLNNFSNCEILSTDGVLKVDCKLTLCPVMYLNLAFNNNLDLDDKCICKKSTLNTKSFSSFINTSFDYTTNYEIKEKVNKILCYSVHFTPTDYNAHENTITVEGKLYTNLIYEATDNDETVIKEVCETFNVKTDVNADGVSAENELDLTFKAHSLNEQTEIEIEDDSSVITVTNQIYVCGASLNPVEIEIVKDLFCVEKEVELSLTNREYVCSLEKTSLTETVASETSLQKDEPAIDVVISNTILNYEILNVYIKDENVYCEGLVYSNLIFIDENKNYGNKVMECPFVINTKHPSSEIKNGNIQLSVMDCKTRVKRGIVIEIEYTLQISYCNLTSNSEEIVSNITFGKQLDFSMYDYQIFIAKPSETKWDICKRIKTFPDELNKLNPNLPDIFEGGEKIIIKR